jgi:hypothetical protein
MGREEMTLALVVGAASFIWIQMVKHLVLDGKKSGGDDLEASRHSKTQSPRFLVGDLSKRSEATHKWVSTQVESSMQGAK